MMRFFPGRRYAVALILTLLVLLRPGRAAAEPAAAPVGEAVAATVNSDPISRAEFQREYRRAAETHAQRGNPVDEASLAPVRQQVIMRLVEDRLLYQESRRRGIAIAEKAVEERLAEIRQAFEDEAAFQAHLHELQMDLATYRGALAQSMAIQALIDQAVTPGVAVSDDEVRAFFEGRPEAFRLPAKVMLRWLLLPLVPGASQAQQDAAQARALAIRRQWEEGEDFAALVRLFSEDPETAPEGLLPEMEQRQVAHFFGPQVWDLAPGQVSPPLVMNLGVCLVRLEHRIPEQTLSLEAVRESVRRYLMKEKTARARRAFTSELQRRAQVKIFIY